MAAAVLDPRQGQLTHLIHCTLRESGPCRPRQVVCKAGGIEAVGPRIVANNLADTLNKLNALLGVIYRADASHAAPAVLANQADVDS